MGNNHFIRYAAGVIIMVLLATSVVMWFGTTSKSHVKHLEEHWTNDNRLAAESAFLITRIHQSFGYGGFIHNFKNLVLRQDHSRIPLIEQNLADTHTAIDQYQALPLNDADKQSIHDFQQVVLQYAAKYELAKQLIEKNTDARVVDQQVKVDDAPAIKALDALANSAHDYSSMVEQELTRDMVLTIGFFRWGLLLIPLFMVVGAVIIYMLRRLTKGQQALRGAKQYVEDMIRATPDALVVVDTKGGVVQANTEAENLFGYEQGELNSLTLEQLIPERFRHFHKHYVHGSFALGQPRPLSQQSELLALTKKGGEIPVEISLSFTHQEGELFCIAAIRDIRQRKQADAKIRLMSKVLDQTHEGILITDSETKIIEMNDAFTHLTGYDKKDLVGKHPPILHSGRHDDAFYHELWQHMEKYGHWKGEIWDRHRNGQLIPYLISISAVEDSGGKITHYVAQYSDITLLKEKEQHLEHLAHFDQLTGLANRMLFQDRLRAAISRAHRNQTQCALLYIDLDGFKQVNDQLGHEVGDEVLIRVARNMKQTTREDDTVARLGGDEFAIILNDLPDCQSAEPLVKRILEGLTFSVESTQGDLPISASIGIALYPTHGETPERLLRCSDQAMYYCKHHGKNGFQCFREEMAIPLAKQK